jgi:anti-sigma B factor antagonist
VAFLWRKRRLPLLLGEEIEAVCSERGSSFQIRLSGRVTIDSSPGLRELFLESLELPACQSLSVDCSGVTYIDTSGLAVLVETLRTARVKGKAFRLTGLQERPRFLLEKTRLLRLFDDSLEAPALHSVPRSHV